MPQLYKKGDTVEFTPERGGRDGVVEDVIPPGVFSLAVRYTVRMSDTQLLRVAKNKDIARLLKKAPDQVIEVKQPEPVSAKRLEAIAILDRVMQFSGGQVAEWSAAEDYLFDFVSQWFSVWLRGKGVANTFVVDLPKLKQDLRLYDGHEVKQPTAALGYRITNAQSFLGAILDIGQRREAETVGYLLKIGANTEVYLSQGDHYAYPLLINGTVPNARAYEHSYVALLGYGRYNTTKTDSTNLMTRGTVPDDLRATTALVATHICESDRNWLQLLATLLELGLYGRTTFESHALNRFPMGGGGWKNHNSWGPGKHPSGGTKDADGYQPRRWLLSVVMDGTKKVQPGCRDLWLALLLNHLGEPQERALVDVQALLQQALGAATGRAAKQE
jgi:hypothetical protein